MDIANHLTRVLFEDSIADGVDQVSLAQTGPAVDEHRVVRRSAGVRRDLGRRSAREVIGLADDQVLESEAGNEARLFVIRASSFQRPLNGGKRGRRRRRRYHRLGNCTRSGRHGPRRGRRCRTALGDHHRNTDWSREEGASKFLDTRQIAFLDPFKDETVGRV